MFKIVINNAWATLTEFSVFLCLCTYLSVDDLVEVEACKWDVNDK